MIQMNYIVLSLNLKVSSADIDNLRKQFEQQCKQNDLIADTA